MRASVSFLDLLHEACKLTFRSRRTLALFGLSFGILAFGSTQASEVLAPLLSQSNETLEELRVVLNQDPGLWIILGSTFFLIGALRSLLRGPLFLTLERLLTEKLGPTTPAPAKKSKLLHAALVSFQFELGYWGICLLVAAIVSLPVLLALRFNPGALPALAQLGFILFLFLAVAFSYIKEFALLYTLLAHARMMIALELGLKLFKKHLFQSLLFGLFLMALSLLFTFIANLAIIASDFAGSKLLKEGMVAISVILILGLSAVLGEALRLLFFHALAATPKLPAVKVKKLLEEKASTSAPTM